MSPSFLIDLLPPTANFLVLCHYDADRLTSGARAAAPHIRLEFPHVAPRESMHAKLHLLWHPTHLRVIVTSANLTEWDHVGMRQTTVYYDVPVRPAHAPPTAGMPFPSMLAAFLAELGVSPADLGLDAFHWPAVPANVRLVCSVPGEHAMDPALPLGLPALPRTALDGLTYQCSSVQAYPSFVQAFTSGLILSDAGRLTVVFPTEARVAEAGRGAAGYLHMAPHAADALTGGDRARLGDVVSPDAARTVLCHSKVLLGQRDGRVAWAYMGSANFSAAAWGTVRGKTITMRNYEVGIAITDPAPSVLTLPFVHPPPLYKEGDRPYVKNIADRRGSGSYDTPERPGWAGNDNLTELN